MYGLFGKLKGLLEDSAVTEIMVNGTDNVYIEKEGKKLKTDIVFSTNKEIDSIIDAVFRHFNRRFDYYCPYGDVCLEDGTRVNAILSSITQRGSAITIRKISDKINDLNYLVEHNSLSSQARDFLIACIKFKLNIIFSGGTGTGKTTLLKLLCDYIPHYERLIVIEDAAELHLPHPNSVSLQTRLPDEQGKGEITLRDLLRNALRMRPDRIILGEIRGGEALDTLQAMSTGHKGTLAVIHGNSPEGAIARLETLVKFSGLAIPSGEIKNLIVSTINIVVHLEQMKDGSRKVAYISEIRGIERGSIVLQHIYAFKEREVDDKGKIKGDVIPVFKIFPVYFQAMRHAHLISDDTLQSKG